MSNLKRKQIYLDEESDHALKGLALATSVSESEHIREAVKQYIQRHVKKAGEGDPLRKIIGLCGDLDGPTDASVHHDRYLYGKKD